MLIAMLLVYSFISLFFIVVDASTSCSQLDGSSGSLLWGEQFGSGADDHAVGLVVGPAIAAGTAVSSNQGAPVGAESAGEEREVGEIGAGGDTNALYLTGWTRGALYSNVAGTSHENLFCEDVSEHA